MPLLKQQFISPGWDPYLTGEGLNTFDSWWTLNLEPVDEGNFDRGGWSTVCRFERENSVFYVKRQSNHLTYKPGMFRLRVPTLKAEFDKINWYHEKEIPCLDVVYFGWRKVQGEYQAVLVTEALINYHPLDKILASNSGITSTKKQEIARSVGRAISKLHDAGIEHRNLYAKHIFVRYVDKACHVRLIYLESSRPMMGLRHRKLRDLETLSRRTERASKSDKLRAFLAYANKRQVDGALRKDIEAINERTADKMARSQVDEVGDTG